MDNVEDLDLVRKIWPVSNHGAILVTSRNHIVSIDPAAAGMEIETFHGEEGAAILMSLVGRSTYDEKEKTAAHKLAAKLGGLALALAVMASQIRLRRKTMVDFLTLYEKHAVQLHKERRGIESYYEHSLADCWSTAFGSLSDHARSLLGVIAYVAPDSIPEKLFKPDKTDLLPPELAFCKDDWE